MFQIELAKSALKLMDFFFLSRKDIYHRNNWFNQQLQE